MIRGLTANQWRDLMTGVMWSCFLVCVMSRAALCWRCRRRWMSLSVKPKSNELQLSSLEVTKELTTYSVARDVRNLTIFPTMWIWWPHDLHSALTCCSISRWESNITPRFFTWGLVETVESPTFIVEMFSFIRRDVEPVMTKSVFFRRSVGVYWGRGP